MAINVYGDIFQREWLEFVKPNDELSPQGNIPCHDKVFTVTDEIYEVSYLIDYLVVTERNVRSVRPGYGLHPKYLPEVLGKKFVKDCQMGERFSLEMVIG